MRLITVPFDYDQKLDPEVVPICIRDTDHKGNAVHLGWIEFGVVPGADKLRTLTKWMLHDAFKVSEVGARSARGLAEEGGDLGTNPDLLIYRGGRRARTGFDVELFVETVEQLSDEYDLIAAMEERDALDKLVAKAIELGMTDAAAMVPMMLRGCSADEYVRYFGKRGNTLTQMFFRHMPKAADAAGLSF